MFKRKLILSFAFLILMFILLVPSVRAEIITFDDVKVSEGTEFSSLYGNIPNGYKGFNWYAFNALMPYYYGVAYPSGYKNSIVSPDKVAWLGFGSISNPIPSVISSDIPFTFHSAYFTAGWNDGVTILVQGYHGTTLTFSKNVLADTSGPTLFSFEWSNLTSLSFTSSGGVSHGYVDFRNMTVTASDFAIDNLNISKDITLKTYNPETEMPVTAATAPCILRWSGAGPNLQQRHTILVKIIAAPKLSLKVYLNAEPLSGAHNHQDTPRPHGWLRTAAQDWQNFPAYGPGSSPGTLSNSTFDTGLSVQTDEQGNGQFYYVASEFSGVETLKVSTIEDDPAQRIAAAQPITLAADFGFGEFSSVDATLVGIRTAHPLSHWGTLNLINALTALAKNYYAETGILLPVNDMSLPFGGLFDIGGDYGPFWDTPHIGHRLGNEVDVDLSSRPGDTIFERILGEQGWWLTNKSLWQSEGNHYHLNIDPAQSGAVTIVPAIVASQWQDQVTRTLSITVSLLNRGGLDAANISLTGITVSSGATFVSPILPFAVGDAPIRVPKNFTLTVRVPAGVKRFRLGLDGYATINRITPIFSFVGSLYINVP